MERLLAVGRMAVGVAHDLNQSLGLMVGHADLARARLSDPAPDLRAARDSLSVISDAGREGAEAIARLIAFARSSEAREPRRVRLADVAREVERLTAPLWRESSRAGGPRVDLVVYADEGVAVVASQADLRAALVNLLLNALDATTAPGSVELRVGRRGSDAVLEVADSGPGMSSEVRARAFEPFFTTKRERGTGLGLSQVRETVERHGGRVVLESIPGEGTTVRIALPAVP